MQVQMNKDIIILKCSPNFLFSVNFSFLMFIARKKGLKLIASIFTEVKELVYNVCLS